MALCSALRMSSPRMALTSHSISPSESVHRLVWPSLLIVIFSSPVPHSVTQSTFANPCTYLAPANGSTGGFDSGLVTAKQFTITVTDDSRRMYYSLVLIQSTYASFLAIWFHCKVQGHCGSGMVGSINAPSTGNTFSSFETAAKALGSNAPQVPFSDSCPALFSYGFLRRPVTKDSRPVASGLLLQHLLLLRHRMVHRSYWLVQVSQFCQLLSCRCFCEALLYSSYYTCCMIQKQKTALSRIAGYRTEETMTVLTGGKLCTCFWHKAI